MKGMQTATSFIPFNLGSIVGKTAICENMNIRKLKFLTILDMIVMVISWVSIYILDYMGIYNKGLPDGLSLSVGWVFKIMFLISVALLALALSIIIIHKITHKVIQKIKKINNRA